MQRYKNILITLLTALISVCCICQQVTPYQGSRIFWDMSSQTTIFSSGTYARLIQLQDGRLMAVTDAGGISVKYSNNLGSMWSNMQLLIASNSSVTNTNAEVIQLSDGTILIGYNIRPREPYSEDRKFGIRVLRSTNNGITWSEPIFVYDASHIWNDGCWEPAFLELPSGEVQCYFANEGPYTTNNDQEISMCRSFDNGLTWSEPVTVCYRQGFRDGMPVPLLLQDESEIVVIIEDNGWAGRNNFAATTVRNSIDDNWENGYVDANSPLRELIFETIPPTNFYSAAPYLRKLPWGETVASYQSNENRPNLDLEYADMYVVVSDEKARNFKAKSAPFAVAQNQKCIWNSVSVIDTGIVVAIGSIGPPYGANHIEMIKGYPIWKAIAKYGTITVDGIKTPEEKWTTKDVNQLPMGQVTKNRTFLDFLYDNNYLYFTARVIDRDIINNTSSNDGVRLFIDTDNVSGLTPQKGMYSFFFDTNGTVRFQYGEDGIWKTGTNTSNIQYAINIHSNYYIFEAAVPWSQFGKSTPPTDERMAIAIEIVNRQQYTVITDKIPDVNNNASWTWLEFRLIPSPFVGIKNSYEDFSDIKTFFENNILHIYSPYPVKELNFYSIDGKLVKKIKGIGQNFQIPLSVQECGIINLLLENGQIVNIKI